MKRIAVALAVAALAVPAAPVAADPVAPAFPEPPSSQKRHAVASDQTMAIVLGGVLLFVVVAAPLFGAESRPGWRNVNRKPTFRMVGSMRPEDWPPSEFKR